MYYSEEELLAALLVAENNYKENLEVNGYDYSNTNCFTYAVKYDKALRGENSVLRSLVDYDYNDTLSFAQGLLQKGWSGEDLFTNNNFELLDLETTPKVGDFAYTQGVSIFNGKGWLSPNIDGVFGLTDTFSLFNNHFNVCKLHGRPLKT